MNLSLLLQLLLLTSVLGQDCTSHSKCPGKEKCKGEHKKNKKCRGLKVDCKTRGTKLKTRWGCLDGKVCSAPGNEKWGTCKVPTKAPSSAPTTSAPTLVTYPAEADRSLGLANPMRGFYWQESYYASLRPGERLSVTSVVSIRESTDQTLMLRLYYLDTFLGSNISTAVLSDMESDFQTMRKAGIKSIIRFAYIDRFPDATLGEVTEPPLPQILMHIAQVQPYLTAAQDIILQVQAGFVGPWGEYHSSTNFPNGMDDGADQIVEKLLEAVPDRDVAIRTPQLKKDAYEVFVDGASTGYNYLQEGSFESNAMGTWSSFGSGGFSTSTDVRPGSTGTQSIMTSSTQGGAARYGLTFFDNAGTANKIITISGWSKTSNVLVGGTPSDYSIYCDLVYTDGTTGWVTANFNRGTHDWEYAENDLIIPKGKDIISLSLYAMYRNDATPGTAWFDDFQFTLREPDAQTGGFVLSANTAHSGTDIARTAHHNDCFLASPDDKGTYIDALETEYPYLSDETKYTSMGGETCATNPPRSECYRAKYELALFHYTYLNSLYNLKVLGDWTTGGCMDEITALLGYRLVLTNGTFSNSAVQGGLVDFKINLNNVGYAAPIHDRRVQLVLRNHETYCAATYNASSARVWYDDVSLQGSMVLPLGIEEGDYEMLLHITDTDTDFRRRLEYKTKVANAGNLNEAETGLIDLQHTLSVTSGSMQEASASSLTVVCGVQDDILPPIIPLVYNGGFEDADNVANDWEMYGGGYAVVNYQMKSGTQSIAIVGNGGAKQKIPLDNAPEGTTVTVSGWSKAVGVTGSSIASDYSLYGDVAYTTGDPGWGLGTVVFDPSRTGWQFVTHTFTLDRTALTLWLYCMYRNDPNSGGVAYFDDVVVTMSVPV